MPIQACLRRGSMKRIVVAPREGRQIGCELGECMACLENAGIRDYSARLERYGVFWVADRLFAIAVKALADAGFEVAPVATFAPNFDRYETLGAPPNSPNDIAP